MGVFHAVAVFLFSKSVFKRGLELLNQITLETEVHLYRDPTLRNGPVVMPRLPTRSAGRYFREDTEESRLLSSINNSEPPAPSGAVRAVSCDFTPKSAARSRRDHPWVQTRAVLPRSGVPSLGRCRPKVPRTGVPRRGRHRPVCLTRPPKGWHRRTFDPSLEYSTDKVLVVLATNVFVFAGVSFVVCRRRRIIFMRGAVHYGLEGPAF